MCVYNINTLSEKESSLYYVPDTNISFGLLDTFGVYMNPKFIETDKERFLTDLGIKAPDPMVEMNRSTRRKNLLPPPLHIIIKGLPNYLCFLS